MGLKEDFIKEASKIERKGIQELIGYLKTTDFFEAPSSTKYHGSEAYGLIEHSLAVYDIAHELHNVFELDLSLESISICSLFHDVCKANFYAKEKRNKKTDGKWHEIEVWSVQDSFPLGHGEKSLFIIQKFIELTNDEALAIRWHLGGFDPGVHFGYPSGFSYHQAIQENKLLALIIIADLSAAYLLDK